MTCSKCITIAFSLAVSIAFSFPAHAVSVNVPPTTFSNFVDGGEAWSAPLSNAIGSDDMRTSVFDASQPAGTDFLVFSGFDFSAIPAGSTIDGLVVTVEGGQAGVAGDPVFVVGATIDNPINAASFADYHEVNANPTISAPPDVFFSIGNATDDWRFGFVGTGLTRADLIDPNFAVMIGCGDADGTGASTFSIDDVQFVVHYTPPPPTPAASSWAIIITAALFSIAFGATSLRAVLHRGPTR